ncbi:hypothetical protein WICMUC_004067 [Wickerhamomyces mucosus]|uniref:Peptidase A1 domain-containing protein n=1 Tax=Wickerhamomyces mucosus TaxID=1378264 RepID=A0A9P8TBX0_9ASCO|nr:hypothetical protein WICMUC_004067 [Wickerhamomyces mucosus]
MHSLSTFILLFTITNNFVTGSLTTPKPFVKRAATGRLNFELNSNFTFDGISVNDTDYQFIIDTTSSNINITSDNNYFDLENTFKISTDGRNLHFDLKYNEILDQSFNSLGLNYTDSNGDETYTLTGSAYNQMWLLSGIYSIYPKSSSDDIELLLGGINGAKYSNILTGVPLSSDLSFQLGNITVEDDLIDTSKYKVQINSLLTNSKFPSDIFKQLESHIESTNSIYLNFINGSIELTSSISSIESSFDNNIIEFGQDILNQIYTIVDPKGGYIAFGNASYSNENDYNNVMSLEMVLDYVNTAYSFSETTSETASSSLNSIPVSSSSSSSSSIVSVSTNSNSTSSNGLYASQKITLTSSGSSSISTSNSGSSLSNSSGSSSSQSQSHQSSSSTAGSGSTSNVANILEVSTTGLISIFVPLFLM